MFSFSSAGVFTTVRLCNRADCELLCSSVWGQTVIFIPAVSPLSVSSCLCVTSQSDRLSFKHLFIRLYGHHSFSTLNNLLIQITENLDLLIKLKKFQEASGFFPYLSPLLAYSEENYDTKHRLLQLMANIYRNIEAYELALTCLNDALILSRKNCDSVSSINTYINISSILFLNKNYKQVIFIVIQFRRKRRPLKRLSSARR